MSDARSDWLRDAGIFARQGNAVEVFVVANDDPRVWLGILTKDRRVLRLMEIASKYFATVRTPDRWPGGKPPLCLTCDHCFVLVLPPVLVIQTPFTVDWERDDSVVVVTGVCADCARRQTADELASYVIKCWGGTECEMTRSQ